MFQLPSLCGSSLNTCSSPIGHYSTPVHLIAHAYATDLWMYLEKTVTPMTWCTTCNRTSGTVTEPRSTSMLHHTDMFGSESRIISTFGLLGHPLYSTIRDW